MAKYNATILIFIFVGVFLLLMVAYAGLSAKDQQDTTNTSEVQVVHNAQDEQIVNAQKPFLMGLGGFYWILLFVVILGGIGIFIKVIWGRRV